MGKPKKQVFEYDKDGVFIKKYESLTELRNEYYSEDVGVRPIFNKKILGFDFHITPKNTIILSDRPYRENIKFLYRVYSSELCNTNKNKNSNKPIQMFNLKNEFIAEFSNMVMAKILLKDKFNFATIYSQLIDRKEEGTKGIVGDYYFKYKKC